MIIRGSQSGFGRKSGRSFEMNRVSGYETGRLSESLVFGGRVEVATKRGNAQTPCNLAKKCPTPLKTPAQARYGSSNF